MFDGHVDMLAKYENYTENVPKVQQMRYYY